VGNVDNPFSFPCSQILANRSDQAYNYSSNFSVWKRKQRVEEEEEDLTSVEEEEEDLTSVEEEEEDLTSVEEEEVEDKAEEDIEEIDLSEEIEEQKLDLSFEMNNFIARRKNLRKQ